MPLSSSDLLARVRKGNDAISEVWLKAVKLDNEGFEKQMQRIDKAWPELHKLCRELFDTGYRGCLYNGNCERTPVCWICPVDKERE
jgi:hypothetical protein